MVILLQNVLSSRHISFLLSATVHFDSNGGASTYNEHHNTNMMIVAVDSYTTAT